MSPPRTARPGTDPSARSASRQRTGTHSTTGHTRLRGAFIAALVGLLTAVSPAAAGAVPAYGPGSARPAGTGVTRYPGSPLRSSRLATIASIGGGGGGQGGTGNGGGHQGGGSQGGTGNGGSQGGTGNGGGHQGGGSQGGTGNGRSQG